MKRGWSMPARRAFTPDGTPGGHRHHCHPGILVLPVLTRARQHARRVVCLNNLRQFVVADSIYAHDFGVLPDPNPFVPPHAQRGETDRNGRGTEAVGSSPDPRASGLNGPSKTKVDQLSHGRRLWAG